MTAVSDSRGRREPSYVLLTPPNRYASRLAGWRDTTVFKLVTPRIGMARFGQYLLEVAPGGGAATPRDLTYEHFVLVTGGELTLGGQSLPLGAFAYLPPSMGLTLTNGSAETAGCVWIKRRYEAADGWSAPDLVVGHVDQVPAETGENGVARRELLPAEDPAFDFNMSLLRFSPGLGLGQVEIHDEEHGLLMLTGAGTYHLDGLDLDVRADDFIYMAPYCPQGFTAGPENAAEYLLYKDVFRDGF